MKVRRDYDSCDCSDPGLPDPSAASCTRDGVGIFGCLYSGLRLNTAFAVFPPGLVPETSSCRPRLARAAFFFSARSVPFGVEDEPCELRMTGDSLGVVHGCRVHRGAAARSSRAWREKWCR